MVEEKNKRLARGPGGVERPWNERERYMLYSQGFRDGAACRSMDLKKKGLGAYDRGYEEGRDAHGKAVAAYAAEIGYVPTILRRPVVADE